jgi:hypothetical protein
LIDEYYHIDNDYVGGHVLMTMKKKIMNVRNSKGKRRDSIYSKKILEYKRSTTGVEWSMSFRISLYPIVLRFYSSATPSYSGSTPPMLHSNLVVLHWYFFSRGVPVKNQWSRVE